MGSGSVRVGYSVSQVVVVMEYEGGIVREYRGVNEDVAIECGAL